jgi:HD superfamily phosphohydrolase
VPEGREVRDPIHGFIYRNDVEEQVIDSPIFQRLRGIRQLALANLVYPGALHTRFDHSLGSMHIAGRIAESIGLSNENRRLVRLTALLHDLGHGPFSHVSEPVLETFADRAALGDAKGDIHETITRAMLRQDERLAHLISERDRNRIIGILDGTHGDAVLHDIISGPLDADKQDYLLRDSYFCGVKYGIYDLDRLIQILTIRNDRTNSYLAIHEDGVNSLEQFVLARSYMTMQVYRHRIRLITDAMIQRGLELGISSDNIDWLRTLYTYDGSPEHLCNFKAWTDDRLINEVLFGTTPDGYAKCLFQRLTTRRLFKRLAYYSPRDFPDAVVRDALAEMPPEMSKAVEKALGEYRGIDPNMVIVQPVTVRSVRGRPKESEGSVVVVTLDGRATEFTEASTLFRSIDQATYDYHLEIYAPVDYRDSRDKKQIQAKCQTEMSDIISRAIQTYVAESTKGPTPATGGDDREA